MESVRSPSNAQLAILLESSNCNTEVKYQSWLQGSGKKEEVSQSTRELIR